MCIAVLVSISKEHMSRLVTANLAQLNISARRTIPGIFFATKRDQVDSALDCVIVDLDTTFEIFPLFRIKGLKESERPVKPTVKRPVSKNPKI
jgi:hypothetical protein